MPKSASSSRGTRPDAVSPGDIITFPNAIRYLLERTDLERMRVIRYDDKTFKLSRTRRILEELGNPHEQVRMVHVAGTVGKGSTVAMIGAMMRGCGYAVGEFTSPHLIDMRERITVNTNQIGKADFTNLIREAAEAAERVGVDPNFFEMLTVVAFRHFAEEAVDIAVIETGLGGRLDSTNVITPEIAIVTHIDLDHTHILGRTLKEIAREKAGIFKRGVPVITFSQGNEVDSVFREVAAEVGAPLRIVDKDIEFSCRFGATPELGPHTRVCLITETSQFMHLPVPLPGEHQARNCALALSVIDTLKASGFDFPELPLLEGLGSTSIPGRMELIWEQPRILIDGAHNAAALGALMRSVGAHVPYDSMVCIFGCCQDKEIPALLQKVALGGDKVIFTRAKGNPRAADPHELQRQFSEVSGKMSQVARTLPEALELAARAVGRDDLICITGSFYLAGEAKRRMADMGKKRAAAAVG